MRVRKNSEKIEIHKLRALIIRSHGFNINNNTICNKNKFVLINIIKLYFYRNNLKSILTKRFLLLYLHLVDKI